jgi:predicted secreted hydrolase
VANWLIVLVVALAALMAGGSVAADANQEPPSRLATLLGSDADAGFEAALAPRAFTFPADHGPHPEFRNEWWYVTGNLDDEDGRRFGFELTFFRFALAPIVPASTSAWRTNQVYIAHLAVTDAGDERFLVAQRYSRGAAGLAGAEAEGSRIWIDDWALTRDSADTWRLRAHDDAFGIELGLRAVRAPVLNGDAGLSQKSAEPGNASYYYSITRLQTEGSIRIGERDYRVSGLSWLDREWSTSALAPDQAGWDWFALQLDDGSELMFYQLRKRDGSRDATSAGTHVSPDGVVSKLGANEVELTVQDRWASPAGGEYPSRWSLSVPRFGLDFVITPVLADQELFTTVRYWEGAVDVRGQNGAAAGRGYVELTGYAASPE